MLHVVLLITQQRQEKLGVPSKDVHHKSYGNKIITYSYTLQQVYTTG